MKKKLKSVLPSELAQAYIRVQSLFFDFPTKEFSLNDLCSAANISKTGAKVVVEQMISEGFLRREIIGRLWRLSCDQKHPYNMTRKVPYHMGLIYESGIIESVHAAIPNVRTIVLFGSYRKGDDVDTSDIDVAIEIVGDEQPKILELGMIPRLGYRKDVVVNLHVFSRNNISLNLFANIANGIVLEGFLEVRP
jgi:predicted nucleotidyltransferase